VLSKIAKRVQDPAVLAMVKWFLKGAGKRGVPQGSPLSPLLANIVLTDLDHALDRGLGVITYVRYLDDMVVRRMASNSARTGSSASFRKARRAGIRTPITSSSAAVLGRSAIPDF
jgi:RNA-directed DNA polymerase